MNIGYNQLMQSVVPFEDGWHVEIPENWMQGRTTYGGLSAALCLEAVNREHTRLPPLRSAQINFIGPAGGQVKITTKVLRRGKSVAFINAEIIGEKGLATQAVFCFGEARQSKLNHDFTDKPTCSDVQDAEDFFKLGPGPVFTNNFECLLADGAVPISGSDKSDHHLWIKFREQVEINATSLLAIGDMPPPAVLPMFKEFAPISSMTWMVNFLQESPTTKDGWWLMRTRAEDVNNGYSSQDMQVWNHDRELIMTGRQSVAIFY
jgi:acyl-CoA thioesterase